MLLRGKVLCVSIGCALLYGSQPVAALADFDEIVISELEHTALLQNVLNTLRKDCLTLCHVDSYAIQVRHWDAQIPRGTTTFAKSGA